MVVLHGSVLDPVLFNLISGLEEGAGASPASLLKTQSWEDWPIRHSVVQPFRRTSAGWRDGHREPSEMQQRQMQGPAPGEGITPGISTGSGLTCWKAALLWRTWGSWLP